MFGNTPLIHVTTQSQLADAAKTLAKAQVIGVDTEGNSFHHFKERVCLIQFSDLNQDYIVDPNTVKDLSCLAPLFSDPAIVKVLHGSDYDIVSLKRDYQFQPHNIFDTMVAAQFLGLPGLGLADLVRVFFGVTLEKKYQRHNWSRRPLSREHLAYARGDTHWLLALRELLLHKLKTQNRLRHFEEECSLLEQRVWSDRSSGPEAFLRIKGAGALDDMAKRVLRHLHAHRQGVASAVDKPVFKVIPNNVLLTLAEERPTTMEALHKVIPKQETIKRKYGRAFLDAVAKGLKDKTPLPNLHKKKVKGPPGKLTGRRAEITVTALKNWRNELCKGTGVLPFSVVSNQVFKSIVHSRPTTLEALRATPEVRNWQVDDYGEAILAVLDATEATFSEPSETSAKPSRRRRRKKNPKTS